MFRIVNVLARLQSNHSTSPVYAFGARMIFIHNLKNTEGVFGIIFLERIFQAKTL